MRAAKSLESRVSRWFEFELPAPRALPTQPRSSFVLPPARGAGVRSFEGGKYLIAPLPALGAEGRVFVRRRCLLVHLPLAARKGACLGAGGD